MQASFEHRFNPETGGHTTIKRILDERFRVVAEEIVPPLDGGEAGLVAEMMEESGIPVDDQAAHRIGRFLADHHLQVEGIGFSDLDILLQEIFGEEDSNGG